MIEALEEAVDRYENLGQLNGAAQAQFQLAEIHRLQHEHTRAVQLYSSAYERFKDTRDYRGMAAITFYMRRHYGQAEVGLNVVREEFKPSRNKTQMGDSVHHLAVMNLMRTSIRRALERYNYSGDMFEHMGHKPELIWNDSRHCQSDAAKLAYNRSQCSAGKYRRKRENAYIS